MDWIIRSGILKQTDESIRTYTADSFCNGKAKNKEALQKELGLPQKKDAFMIGIVSRLTDQKGIGSDRLYDG